MNQYQLHGVNPRTGISSESGVELTSAQETRNLIDKAQNSALEVAQAPVDSRINWLKAIAIGLEREREMLIELAETETALGIPRLTGELQRTTSQILLFAEVLADGSFLHTTIDNAQPDATPVSVPEIRTQAYPVGPVAVWAASNFPFAFGVIGGDSVSALAAGCPVIVKAHPSQPSLSEAIGKVVTSALSAVGAPAGYFSLVCGMEAGEILISDPHIRAAAFTGSVAGGRALHDLAAARPEPIPFYGELGSINPVFVTESAATERAAEIAAGLTNSATLGTGQFCTKPGLVFVPRESSIVSQAMELFSDLPKGFLLNRSIWKSFMEKADSYQGLADTKVVGEQNFSDSETSEFSVAPRLVITDSETYLANVSKLIDECFGPLTVIVEYAAGTDLSDLAGSLSGSLTSTIHGSEADADEGARTRKLIDQLRYRSGRLIWNGWPTGVAVNWSMQHGGPFPASTISTTTSVGANAIQRFLRPVAYQNFPTQLLPVTLQDGGFSGFSRIDGRAEIR